jgi:oligosaccharide repeat unit polymerase
MAARWIGWLMPAALTLSAVFFFFVFLFGREQGDIQSAAALAVTALPFIVAAREAPERLLHPLAVFGFTMVLGIAGQTIYLADATPLRADLLSGLSPDILNRGLLVVGAGVTSLCLGYLAYATVRKEPSPGPGFRWLMDRGFADPSPRRALWIVLALLVIAALGFAIYAPKVGIDSVDSLLSSRKRFAVVDGQVVVYGYYRWVIGLCGIGFLFAVYTIVRNGLSWRSKLGVAAMVSILGTAGFAVVTSSRTELFGIVAMAAFIVIALRRREPRPGVILGLGIAALVAVTLLVGLRSASAGTGEQDQRSQVSTLMDDAVGSRDWMGVGPIAVVVDRVPEAYPFQYGETLASILWEPIPRTIWKSKPPVRIGPTIGPPVYRFHPSERISGDPPGILGEFWINGGLIAVILGMAFLGIAIGAVERWYDMVGSTGGLSALFYGVVGIGVCLQLPIADFTGILTIIVQNLVILAILFWLARRPVYRQGRIEVGT